MPAPVKYRIKLMDAATRKVYNAWADAVQRTTNKSNKDYHNYGGRGIQMCGEWRRNFNTFLAYVGFAPEGCMLDRENNDGNYEPGNVRWVTRQVSNTNKRK